MKLFLNTTPTPLNEGIELQKNRFAHTPLYSMTTIREIETQYQKRPYESSLMARAGHALYRLAQACYPHAQNILIIAGKGNNGGDAIIAANHLFQKGKQVHLLWLGSTQEASEDTLQALQSARGTGLPLHAYESHTAETLAAKPFDLIIDGLYGIGINIKKELDDVSKALINFINGHQAPVIAIDIPSGLFANNGSIHSHVVKADHTLTFIGAKPGLFTAHGREYCGQVWLDTLESSAHHFMPCAHLYAPAVYSPKRSHNTHKGSFGDVSIIGGATGMVGAALLAARAAIKAGAGRVYASLLDQDSHSSFVDTHCPELMFKPLDQISLENSTVVCGCGAGKAVEHTFPALLQKSPRLVLDADALNAIAVSSHLQEQLQARKEMGLETIITPHPLEAARLLGISTQDIQNSRLEFAQTLANMFNCTCVLKGSGSIIATPAKPPFINSSGNAALATAGSGDVLAGWIGGRWSASYQTQIMDLHELTAQCVWEHGHAADDWVELGHSGALCANTLIQWIKS